MKSATTYIAEPIEKGDDEQMAKTMAAAKKEAATRLGGDDGLECIDGPHALDGGMVGMTWRREWEDTPKNKEVAKP